MAPEKYRLDTPSAPGPSRSIEELQTSAREDVTLTPLLSRREAAVYLGLSVRTLAIWASTGRYALEVVKIGRLSKYRKSALDKFINDRATL
ncbi:excisionase family DNA binding protein [Jezberella montanilacus]|uniref:Excisionase family DNA binding protein n=1 Tax=Jezberella montanilacus TaxID=323426 RepID=A0A2T0XPI2_9BURK|nr:helix-turn-helix domain-containing protein [Jezberella montanilacus]PRZ00782.1 excisionase family DNA binding protein [Jezberella montanilacus]